LLYRLRFHLSKAGASPTSPDAEDLYHDVLTKLVKALNEAREQRKSTAIKDFRQYAARVAVNACNDYLRSKYPARARLKDKIRDTLERHPDFAVWRSEQGETVCGFAVWRDELKPGLYYERVRLLEEQPERVRQEGSALSAELSRAGGRKILLTGVIAGVFNWVGCPIELESLVNATAVLLDVKEQQIESLDDGDPTVQAASERPSGFNDNVEKLLEEKTNLRKLWEEICRLPDNQRDTFIFSFEDSRGEDLLSLLFDAGAVPPSQMAQALGLSLDQLMERWKEMPMSNGEIASLIGVERSQINKWRHRARKQIEKRLLESN
jgi:RNA polymerase sigma factor (sigma-70 family)